MERRDMPSSKSKALNTILNPSTVAFWNSNIRATSCNGLHCEALLLYRRMKRAGVHPDHLTFPFLLKSCANISDSDLPPMVHTHVLKSPFSADVFVGTTMVNLYAKCSLLDPAEQVFDEMPSRDAVAWNAMILGLADNGSHGRVFFMFQNMRLVGIKPDSITIISLTQSCAQKKDSSLLRSVHSVGIRIGFGDCVSVCNTWISSYAKCEDLCSAESVFESIPQSTKSIVSWNSMIAGCAHLRRSGEAVSYFTFMRRGGVRPDLSTVLCLLSAFGHSGDLALGEFLHSLAIKEGFHLDISVSNTLISLYSKSRDLTAAQRCFDSMTDRTCVSWAAIIGGYSKAGDIGQVMYLFHAMESRADAVTVVAILSACGQTGSLEFGRSMERYADLNMLGKNVMVRNGLIDMYAKCGSMADARRVFETMEGRNVVSWTSLIAGCAMNGDFEEALRLFSRMLEQELEPNHVTFVAVLQACNHGGLLEKGRDLFDMMRNEFGLEPSLEHYACISDLLGRRGKIKEALEFIERMPMEPDCGVWGALLGSCIIYRETEAGEFAWSRLLELNPDAAVPYVAMANIYASKEKWEGVARLRLTMRKKGLWKSPGRSMVQVSGRVHAFVVDDRVHPQGSFIYEVLESLALNLKIFHSATLKASFLFSVSSLYSKEKRATVNFSNGVLVA
ncbi:Pentatricopeptide repeat-containing protein [Platanthera zijinensis]|uniref:Pentatricopeptide repeat-containing protein n=1 Tax=Platanthera zijinensis TaxID=2320716 RepID=A0AAP0G0L8_9ASPA